MPHKELVLVALALRPRPHSLLRKERRGLSKPQWLLRNGIAISGQPMALCERVEHFPYRDGQIPLPLRR
jgi:hypothetical protein